MKIFRRGDFRFVGALAMAAFFSIAFGRAYVRIQTTLIGYELGALKKKEAGLLENRSRLQMELAKLTTKSSLQLLADDAREAKSLGAYAAQ